MALYKGSVRIAGIGSFPDQIQYMSQDDYDAMSESEKMNGTTYGIIGTGESGGDENAPYIESLVRWMAHEPLASGSGEGTTKTVEIPEGANLILLVNYTPSRKDLGSDSTIFSLKSSKALRDFGLTYHGVTSYGGYTLGMSNVTDTAVTITCGSGMGFLYYFF